MHCQQGRPKSETQVTNLKNPNSPPETLETTKCVRPPFPNISMSSSAERSRQSEDETFVPLLTKCSSAPFKCERGPDANRQLNEAREASLFRKCTSAALHSQNSLQLYCICSSLLAPRARLSLPHLCTATTKRLFLEGSARI